MENKYGLYLSREGMTVRLPVNPESYSITQDNDNGNYNVLGIGAIMGAKKVLLAASGAEKADAILGAVTGAITPHCPGSVLQLHPNVVVVVDEAAGSKLKAAGVPVCG